MVLDIQNLSGGLSKPSWISKSLLGVSPSPPEPPKRRAKVTVMTTGREETRGDGDRTRWWHLRARGERGQERRARDSSPRSRLSAAAPGVAASSRIPEFPHRPDRSAAGAPGKVTAIAHAQNRRLGTTRKRRGKRIPAWERGRKKIHPGERGGKNPLWKRGRGKIARGKEGGKK